MRFIRSIPAHRIVSGDRVNIDGLHLSVEGTVKRRNRVTLLSKGNQYSLGSDDMVELIYTL